MSLTLFGIVQNGMSSGTITGFVQTFYCSSPITDAKLLINNIKFDSIFVGPEIVGTFPLYKMVFFSNTINLPLGSADNVTLIVKGAVDGSVVLYTTIQ